MFGTVFVLGSPAQCGHDVQDLVSSVTRQTPDLAKSGTRHCRAVVLYIAPERGSFLGVPRSILGTFEGLKLPSRYDMVVWRA